MSFLTRWESDHSRPQVPAARKDLLLRAVLPAIPLWAAIVGFGYLLKGPLTSMANEEKRISRVLAADRDGLWNSITMVMSHIGNTEYVIGACLLLIGIIWWRTKEWWYAVVPGIAISLQASVFVLATLAIGRERPPVSKLDPAPPTSSYPSGHVGAATALYLTLALMAATRIRHRVWRAVAVLVCAVVPFVVLYARLYRGMHHVSDVVVGMLNGIVCMLLAWAYLRRDASHDSAGAPEQAGGGDLTSASKGPAR